MQTRKLGRSGLKLTTLGLGTWAIGGPWLFGWGPQDDEASLNTIHAALDGGINWIDTAAVYGLGHAETVVGRAIKGRRDGLVVATKCGLIWDDLRRVTGHLRPDSVRAECENSLRRLDIDVIDLYQIHWPNPDEQIEFAWEELARLKEEGKIRHAGVSNFNVDQMKRLQNIMPIDSLQPPYSMLRREVEREILPFSAENEIGVVAYAPMQNGLLTGKFTEKTIAQLPEDDFRKTKNPEFQPPRLQANLEFVEALRPLSEKAGLTPAQFAVAWTLRRPEVTSAIVGMRAPAQAAPLLPAADARIDEGILEKVASLLEERDEKVRNAS